MGAFGVQGAPRRPRMAEQHPDRSRSCRSWWWGVGRPQSWAGLNHGRVQAPVIPPSSRANAADVLERVQAVASPCSSPAAWGLILLDVIMLIRPRHLRDSSLDLGARRVRLDELSRRAVHVRPCRRRGASSSGAGMQKFEVRAVRALPTSPTARTSAPICHPPPW